MSAVPPLAARSAISPAPADYVKVRLFEAITGYTADAVDAKIRRGVWKEGREYVRAPDGNILIHMPSYYAWAAGQQPGA